MIEKGDSVRCTGQLVMKKLTAGTPEDIDRMGSPRSGQVEFEDTTVATHGVWKVVGIFGRFASLEHASGNVTAWPVDQLVKEV